MQARHVPLQLRSARVVKQYGGPTCIVIGISSRSKLDCAIRGRPPPYLRTTVSSYCYRAPRLRLALVACQDILVRRSRKATISSALSRSQTPCCAALTCPLWVGSGPWDWSAPSRAGRPLSAQKRTSTAKRNPGAEPGFLCSAFRRGTAAVRMVTPHSCYCSRWNTLRTQ